MTGIREMWYSRRGRDNNGNVVGTVALATSQDVAELPPYKQPFVQAQGGSEPMVEAWVADLYLWAAKVLLEEADERFGQWQGGEVA